MPVSTSAFPITVAALKKSLGFKDGPEPPALGFYGILYINCHGLTKQTFK